MAPKRSRLGRIRRTTLGLTTCVSTLGLLVGACTKVTNDLTALARAIEALVTVLRGLR